MSRQPATVECPRCGMVSPRTAERCTRCNGVLSPTGYSRFGTVSNPSLPQSQATPVGQALPPGSSYEPPRPARTGGGNRLVAIIIFLIIAYIVLSAVFSSRNNPRTTFVFVATPTPATFFFPAEPTLTVANLSPTDNGVSEGVPSLKLTLTTGKGSLDLLLYGNAAPDAITRLVANPDNLRGKQLIPNSNTVRAAIYPTIAIAREYNRIIPRSGTVALRYSEVAGEWKANELLIFTDTVMYMDAGSANYVVIGEVGAARELLTQLGDGERITGVDVTIADLTTPVDLTVLTPAPTGGDPTVTPLPLDAIFTPATGP